MPGEDGGAGHGLVWASLMVVLGVREEHDRVRRVAAMTMVVFVASRASSSVCDGRLETGRRRRDSMNVRELAPVWICMNKGGHGCSVVKENERERRRCSWGFMVVGID